jgi:hypothetical protein
MLPILPVFIGPVAFLTFSFIGAFFWGLLFFIWLWVFRMLWEVNPQGWMFMVLIATFDLIWGYLCPWKVFMGSNGTDHHYQRTGLHILHDARHKRCIRSPVVVVTRFQTFLSQELRYLLS